MQRLIEIRRRDGSYKNLGVLVAALIVLILIFSYLLFLPKIIENPVIIPISDRSNQEVLVQAKKVPFFVKANDQILFASYNPVDKVWSVKLGRYNGIIEVGGYIDVGFNKILSQKPETIKISRDYDAPKALSKLKKYYTDSKGFYTIEMNIEKDEYVEVVNNGEAIYRSDIGKNICKKLVNADSANDLYVIECPYDFNESKEIGYKIFVKDQARNIFEIQDGLKSKLVATNNFNCDYEKASITEKIVCQGNKDGKIIIGEKTYTYKSGAQINLPIALKDGKNTIELTMVDEHDFEKKLAGEVILDNIKPEIKIANIKKDGALNLIATSNKDVSISVVSSDVYNDGERVPGSSQSVEAIKDQQINILSIPTSSKMGILVKYVKSTNFTITATDKALRTITKNCTINYDQIMLSPTNIESRYQNILCD